MRTATEAAAHLIATLGDAAHQRASDHYMNYENQITLARNIGAR